MSSGCKTLVLGKIPGLEKTGGGLRHKEEVGIHATRGSVVCVMQHMKRRVALLTPPLQMVAWV